MPNAPVRPGDGMAMAWRTGQYEEQVRIVSVWTEAERRWRGEAIEAVALFDWVLGLVSDLLGRTEAGVFLLNHDRSGIELVAHSGQTVAAQAGCRVLGLEEGGIAGSAVFGRAEFGRAAARSPDATIHCVGGIVASVPVPIGMTSHSEGDLIASVPIRAGTRLLGALAVYGAGGGGGDLSCADRSVLLAVGRQVGDLLIRCHPFAAWVERERTIRPLGPVRLRLV